MNTKEREREKEVLKTLFDRMPEEALPASFRENVMRKVLLEAVKTRKRKERIGLAWVVFASVLMAVMAGWFLWHLGEVKMELRIPDLTVFPFYIYVGVLVLILLFADYKLRQEYTRRHES